MMGGGGGGGGVQNKMPMFLLLIKLWIMYAKDNSFYDNMNHTIDFNVLL